MRWALTLALLFAAGCANVKNPFVKQSYLTPSELGVNGPVCNEDGWKGIDPDRWDELARPDGETLICDTTKPPGCGSDCDYIWHWDCELTATYPIPVALQWWDIGGPNKTHGNYYPCVYFCNSWVWHTNECKWMCTDGDACCQTTCNNLGNMYGDADGDGDVDLADYAAYQRYIGQGSQVFGRSTAEKEIMRASKGRSVESITTRHRLEQ